MGALLKHRVRASRNLALTYPPPSPGLRCSAGTQQALLSHAVEQVQRAQHASDTAKAQQALPEASFLAIRKPAAGGLLPHAVARWALPGSCCFTPAQQGCKDKQRAKQAWSLAPCLRPRSRIACCRPCKHIQQGPSYLPLTTSPTRPSPPDAGQQLTWEVLRGLGAGFWLADAGQAREVAERLAKAQFAASRNADDCALLYCAMGKKSVLQVGGTAGGVVLQLGWKWWALVEEGGVGWGCGVEWKWSGRAGGREGGCAAGLGTPVVRCDSCSCSRNRSNSWLSQPACPAFLPGGLTACPH